MLLKNWDELPNNMKTPIVKEYYDILTKRRASLLLKRILDVVLSIIMLVILIVPMLIISVIIKIDSRGSVFFRQTRITSYGKAFRIHKFRTMITNADVLGTQITVNDDYRVTKVGKWLRKTRLDEVPQLIDIIKGDMSFVGTRPEVEKYVCRYTTEMMATLLLPAGVTSEASIRYKDEATLLYEADDVDEVYVKEILAGKMKYNLKSIRDFTVINDIKTICRTISAVMGKDN